jgi:deazaflavin-dependent oxidoreductase (nitroreductase family)
MVLAIAVVAGATIGFAAFVLVAMRTKSPAMLTVVRRFNRGVTNKLQVRVAGRQGAYASVIRHEGRRSGRTYQTPIVPFPTDGGFLVSLPYGPSTDWVQNVLAAGSAVLVHDGTTVRVDEPEVVPTSLVADRFPTSEQRTHRLFRVEHCLRLHEVEATPTAGGDHPSP